MKHTQGNWELKQHSQFANYKDIVVDGKCILSIANQRATDEEAEANAKLIAAAPELLEALQLLLKASYRSAESIIETPVEVMARKAIEKATN